MKLKILGQNWTLEERPAAADPRLGENDGYTDSSVRLCVVDDMSGEDQMGKADLRGEYLNHVKRHELVHAFLFESGLDVAAPWVCEEMVDWLAIQFPKLLAAFKRAGCI